MKKLILILIIFTLSFSLTGCEKIEETKKLLMSETDVSLAVKNWALETNPAFRYEIRFPKRWVYHKSDELGKEVILYSEGDTLSDTYHGAMKIIGFVNWQTEYTLAEYYQNEKENNLFEQGFENEEIEHRSFKATWFKNVNTIYTDKEIDVVVFNLGDRIVEFQLIEDWDTTRTIFNSNKFYGDSGFVIPEE